MSHIRIAFLLTVVFTVALRLQQPRVRRSGPCRHGRGLLRGTSDGVCHLNGVVSSGPQLTNRLTTTPAQIWSLVAADGTMWAGTGGDGRVMGFVRANLKNGLRRRREQRVRYCPSGHARLRRDESGREGMRIDGAPRRARFDPAESHLGADCDATEAVGRHG